MNPKVVFRCFFISVLLAAPTPLLLAGIVHLTNAPLAEQWLAEAAFSVYAAVAFGCFIMLFLGTLAAVLAVVISQQWLSDQRDDITVLMD